MPLFSRSRAAGLMARINDEAHGVALRAAPTPRGTIPDIRYFGKDISHLCNFVAGIIDNCPLSNYPHLIN